MITNLHAAPRPPATADEDSGPGSTALLERLMAVVRPEFRVDVLVPAPDDPILGGTVCRVEGCERLRTVRGLCSGHRQRWRSDGDPPLEQWLTTAPALLRGRQLLPSCSAPGCKYGRGRRGLCDRHHKQWHRAGQPEADTWLLTLPAVSSAQGERVCALPQCDLWVHGQQLYCQSHTARWRDHGRPSLEEFIVRTSDYGEERFDFRPLPRQLRLELQYGLQCRADSRTGRYRPRLLAPALKITAALGVQSLLELTQDELLERLAGVPGQHTMSRSFLTFTHEQLLLLLRPAGWDGEYPRDIWDLRQLRGPTGGGGGRHLRFDRIAQPWLRELAKRWCRWRLSTGLARITLQHDVLALTRLSKLLSHAKHQHVTGLHQLTREDIEAFIADAHLTRGDSKATARLLSTLRTFLEDVRRHQWAPVHPAAGIYPEDFPRHRQVRDRHLPEDVMRQLELPANLDRLATPQSRLITLILIRCGLRIGDATKLRLDCVIRDGDSHPYLRYINHKMRREAFVPLDDEVAEGIRAQQQRVRSSRPDQADLPLFPSPIANATGRRAISESTYRAHLYRWLVDCKVRDEHGAPVHLTPHQWRHTFATRLINLGVSQEVIRKLLDHSSLEMTAHYAKVHDSTVREQWERARKVDADGQSVALASDSPLSEAAWSKTAIDRARHALPNGYCTLPLQKSCPTIDGCFSCPMFLTTNEFLPQHLDHADRTRRLIATAEANGQFRMVESNTRLLAKLNTIVAGLETPPAGDNLGTDDPGQQEANRHAS